METNSKLVKDSFLGILIVNLISMISGILCVMIDAIVTGQFLGADAMTATGLLQPVVMVCNLFGATFGPGVAVVCTRFMGMAKKERVNQVFSIVVIALCLSGALVAVLLFVIAPSLGSALGGKTGSEEIVSMITAYLRGFSLGLLPMYLSMSLTGLMMMDNDRQLAIMSMVMTLIADVIFDLANAMVFHGGMWGMAVATALSQLAGLVTVLTHFRKENRVLHLTFKDLNLADLKEVIMCGIPAAIPLGSQALRGFVFNALLLSVAGTGAVTALSVCNSAFSVIFMVGVSVLTSTSTLSSLFYGEKDRGGLVQTLGLSLRIVLIVNFAITLILLLAPQFVVGLFLNAKAASELAQAAHFLRFMGLQFFLFSASYSISGAYQGTRQLRLNYLIDLSREAIFPILSALVLGKLLGLKGFELAFIFSGFLLLLSCLVYPWIAGGKCPRSVEDILLLPEDFGPKPEELFIASMSNMDEVMEVSQKVKDFCDKQNATKRVSMMTSLFVEEMAGNIVQHGFVKGRKGSVDLRLIYHKDSQVIRLRDNGIPFDPAEWLKRNHPEDPASGVGIRMIIGLASEVKYTPALGLNNLMVII